MSRDLTMPRTVEEVRAAIEAARGPALAKFRRDWRGLSPREALMVAVENAEQFSPTTEAGNG